MDVVNTQADRLSSLEKMLGTVFLRQILLAEARNSVGPTPHEEFLGVVEGRVERHGRTYLQVRPQGLSAEASGVIPELLVPCTRALEPGSVVEVKGELEDPDAYDASEGVIIRAAEVRAVVPIEP